jgi:hypothetical protein
LIRLWKSNSGKMRMEIFLYPVQRVCVCVCLYFKNYNFEIFKMNFIHPKTYVYKWVGKISIILQLGYTYFLINIQVVSKI